MPTVTVAIQNGTELPDYLKEYKIGMLHGNLFVVNIPENLMNKIRYDTNLRLFEW